MFPGAAAGVDCWFLSGVVRRHWRGGNAKVPKRRSFDSPFASLRVAQDDSTFLRRGSPVSNGVRAIPPLQQKQRRGKDGAPSIMRVTPRARNAGPSIPHSLRSGSLRMTGYLGGSEVSQVSKARPGAPGAAAGVDCWFLSRLDRTVWLGCQHSETRVLRLSVRFAQGRSE